MSEQTTAATPYRGVFQPHLLRHGLREAADRVVLEDSGGESLTGAQVAAVTSQLCQALNAAGFGPGSRVGILAGNRLEVLHATHALMLNESVLVPLHPMGSLDDYLYVVKDAAVEALIFDPALFGSRIAELQQHALPTLTKYFSLGPSDLGDDLLTAAARYDPADLPDPDLASDDVYRLSYTGGTTGRPKGVIGTQAYALTLNQIMLSEWEWPSEVRQLVCTPLSHSGAPLFLPSLLRGGSAFVLQRFDPELVLRTIQEQRITCVLLVPTMLYALLDHPSFGDYDLSSLETVFYGAAPMSPRRMEEAIGLLGPIFFQFYGQTEAPMSVFVLRRGEHLVGIPGRLATCGRPVPWVHTALLDAAGEPVPDGEPGEICVRGPLVMGGYLNKPEQTAEALEGGWLHTGDVGVRDADGFVRIVDRTKDMIITGGFNVYPREVEDVLGRHDAVAQCAVIGVPDERWGEAVAAYVVLRPGAAECGDELVALVRDAKGPVQAPKVVSFVGALPVTPLGKIDKKALRALQTEPASA